MSEKYDDKSDKEGDIFDKNDSEYSSGIDDEIINKSVD